MQAIERTPVPRGRRGFHLIEILGVMTVGAILAAVLTPRVVTVVARGKANGTAESLDKLKTSTEAYLGRNASVPLRAGTGSTNAAVSVGRFDSDLVAAGLLEKLFACSIGLQTDEVNALTGRTHVRALSATRAGVVTAPTATVGGDNYDLDRNPVTADFTTGQRVVSAFIPFASLSDAIALNKLLDADDNVGNGADTTGRCIYSEAADDNTVTIYVYIAHR